MSTSLEALRRHRRRPRRCSGVAPRMAVPLPRVLRSRRAGADRRGPRVHGSRDPDSWRDGSPRGPWLHPTPARPHRRGSFEVLFTREAFADYVSCLRYSGPPWLDILVHPLTGSHVLDHTRSTLPLRTPLATDCTLLKEADARLFAAGRSEQSIIEGTRTRAPARRVERKGWGGAGEYGENAASKRPGVCFEAMNRTT